MADLSAAASAAGVDLPASAAAPARGVQKGKKRALLSKPIPGRLKSDVLAQLPQKPQQRDDTDPFAKLAKKHWPSAEETKFSEEVLASVYRDLKAANFPPRRVNALEFSHFLENFLWPHFTPAASRQHVLACILMVNEKFLEQTSAWTTFQARPEHFAAFINRVFALCLGDDEEVSTKEHCFLIVFLIRLFQSVEHDLVRQQLQPIMGLGTWHAIPAPRREQLLRSGPPKLAKAWDALEKKRAAASAEEQQATRDKDLFVWRLVHRFLQVLEGLDEHSNDAAAAEYCHRVMELLIDIEALLSSRRFLNSVLAASFVLLRCTRARLAAHPVHGRLFRQLLELLRFYGGFEITDFSGEPLTDAAMLLEHYRRVGAVQRVAFERFREQLEDFALSNVAAIETREAMQQHTAKLTDKQLFDFLCALKLVAPTDGDGMDTDEAQVPPRTFLEDVLAAELQRRTSQIDSLNQMPLYPTEKVLWDENVVPTEVYTDGCLALPKLNLQFLTMFDYLLRNLNLFYMESTYEIRQEVEDCIPRLKPALGDAGTTVFGGWARMAHPISGVQIVEVGKPNLGEMRPSSVRADVTINFSVPQHIRKEWQGLRKHDVGFLISLSPPHQLENTAGMSFQQRYGIRAIRGCEIEGMLDAKGHVIEERPDEKPLYPKGDARTFRVWLDTNQYYTDTTEDHLDVYDSLNVFMRRNPKENNFKAVLDTIRKLMNTQCVVPDWLHDIFLGYGDPGSAHYSKLESQIPTLNFHDTFLDLDHLRASFPSHQIKTASDDVQPPFVLTFPSALKRKPQLVPRKVQLAAAAAAAAPSDAAAASVITVGHAPAPESGPYPQHQPRVNTVRFTPTQVEAIRAGMQPGLTMVVGPPGTGKTDVAVQIIANIYRNAPHQRTLVVAHSNQALNQLFEKIIALDVDERHLLRLGRGEELLDTEKDFSRYGRINYILGHRVTLLREVERLADSLGKSGADMSSTCETAGNFYQYHVLPRWAAFESAVATAASPDDVDRLFPFAQFFSDVPAPLLKGDTIAARAASARTCMAHIEAVFHKLEEFRPFELLHKGRDRTKYLLTKEAKIIAMTCTHAALTHTELTNLGFTYDNVLMEEAAQILEVETFIPLMLQKPVDGFSRLKRVILIGDHHQLPPVIKNMAFKKFSNMEQSLFTRFVRLGVPVVQLDAQGRSRPSISALWSWRYHNLGNLPHTQTLPEYTSANGGFRFDYQLVDVGDLNGKGETTPEPYFYQNLAEAEYVVATFMYMRLLGYPAHKITILTTYNGQKALLQDVVNARCARHPLFGLPGRVETVDKFQGSQNDYVLLSLVRTVAVGHLRDVRRLVVALSRARLGLYVFCRKSVFEGCYELAPAMKQFVQRPSKLHLFPDEMYGTPRLATATDGSPMVVEGLAQMADYVFKRACGVVQQYDAYAASLAAGDTTQGAQSEDDGASSGGDEEEGDATGAVAGEAEATRADVADGKDGDEPAQQQGSKAQPAAQPAAMDSQ